MSKDKKKDEGGKIWCRAGAHAVPRNKIAVHYEPGFGLCGYCILRRCRKVREYWTAGCALDSRVNAAGVPGSDVI